LFAPASCQRAPRSSNLLLSYDGLRGRLPHQFSGGNGQVSELPQFFLAKISARAMLAA